MENQSNSKGNSKDSSAVQSNNKDSKDSKGNSKDSPKSNSIVQSSIRDNPKDNSIVQSSSKGNPKDNPKDNPIADKSFDFAVRIVKFSKWLRQEHKEYELASQVLRSGTSIGANIAEAQYAQSKPDFISKMHIALKEASETAYWLRLIVAAGIVSSEDMKSLDAKSLGMKSLQNDASEITKILASIVKTSKESM